MTTKVLVAYATKYGATAGIAEQIGQVLRQADLSVDVVPAHGVSDLSAYPAVVLGSAVYFGRWQKAAAQFLNQYETALSNKSVWLFSSGPTGEGDPVTLTKGWVFPEGLQSLADRIQPRDVVVFSGALDVGQLNFIERWIIQRVQAPMGDFRDWAAIAAWAKQIAEALQAADLAAGASSSDAGFIG
jgi:menaquinone-dependent protoporphyrinogen oxidase